MHKYNDIRDVSQLARTVYEYELMPLDELFSVLLAGYQTYATGDDTDLRKAFELGKKFHDGQLRKSGAPYFSHPLIVGILMLPHQPDQKTLIATMLHDLIEDTEATEKDIEFLGDEIMEMIDGLTKISQSHIQNEKQGGNTQEKLETIRKILQYGEHDMRVLVIKVFDRLHNILTLFWKQNLFSTDRYLKQTVEIYIPIAKRIGLRDIYHELCFHANYYLRSQRFHRILDEFEAQLPQMEKVTEITQEYLKKATKTPFSSVQYHKRNLFSIDNKQDPNDLTVYDLFFIEIVVPKLEDCYRLLKELNSPMDMTLIPVGMVRDYVSRPKLSKYRALQLAAIIKGQNKILIHILSQEMYDNRTTPMVISEIQSIYGPVLFRDFDLIDEATKSNSDKFINAVMGHVFAKKMQIHNPKKNEVYVPYNFSALDAAIYLFPKKIGHIKSIVVNQEHVSFGTMLNPNDIVEVNFTTGFTAEASWLKYLQSETSRYRLQMTLKEENKDYTITYGQQILQEHFDNLHLGKVEPIMDRESLKKLGQAPEEVYQMLGQGTILPIEVIEGLGRTKRAWFAKMLRAFFKKLNLFGTEFDVYRPYIKFSFYSNEPSPHKFTRDLYETCSKYSVDLMRISCKKRPTGTYCRVHLTSEDKKKLYEAFLEVSTSDHIIATYVHLKKRFKLKIIILFALVAAMWMGLYSLIPWFHRNDYLAELVYVSIVPPLIANVLLYRFFISYFSSWRHNKKLLIFIMFMNILGISIFSYLMFHQGLDTLQLSVFFPLIIVLATIVHTSMLYLRSHARPTQPFLTTPGDKDVKTKVAGYLIRLGAVTIWGLQPIVFRYAVDRGVTTSAKLPVMFLGMTLMSLVLTGLFLAFRQRGNKVSWKVPVNRHFFLISISLILLYFLYTLSLSFTTSTNVILLNNFAPVFTLFVALIFWRSEYAYLRNMQFIRLILLVFIIGSVGSTLLFFNDIRGDVAGNVKGNVIALAMMVVDIFFVVGEIRYVKSLRNHLTPHVILVISAGACAISLVFIGSVLTQIHSLETFVPILLSGCMIALGLVLNLEAFKRIDGFIAHLMFNISILITFFLEAFYLGEITPGWLILTAIVLIMGASFCAELINIRAQKSINT